MQAAAITNPLDAYEIRLLKLWPISINTYQDEVIPNLVLLLSKFI